MKARYPGQCVACFRTLPVGTEVRYARGRGLRCAGGCAPISTAELVAGRERHTERAARQPADRSSLYERHDRANEAIYADRGATKGRP